MGVPGGALQGTQAGNNAAPRFGLQSESLSDSVHVAPTTAGPIGMAPSRTTEHPGLCFRFLVGPWDVLNAVTMKMEYCGRYLECEG